MNFFTEWNSCCQIIILMTSIQSFKMISKSSVSTKILSTCSGAVLKILWAAQKAVFFIFPSLKCAKVDSMELGSVTNFGNIGKNSTTIKTVCGKLTFIVASLKDISALLGGAWSYKQKQQQRQQKSLQFQFNSWSAHMPRWQVWSPTGARTGGKRSVFLSHRCFSLSLSLCSPLTLPLPLKINKHIPGWGLKKNTLQSVIGLVDFVFFFFSF